MLIKKIFINYLLTEFERKQVTENLAVPILKKVRRLRTFLRF